MENLKGNKWVEIDILAIKNNLLNIQAHLADRARLIGVVKANGYGHGAIEVARILQQNGVDFLAVSYLDEALKIRNSGIKSSIMLFSPLIDELEIKEAIENEITLAITSIYDSQLINKVSSKLRIPVNIHLKVDTGLGRFGIYDEDLIDICNDLLNNPFIYIEGIFTHVAEANNEKHTINQFKQFTEIINKLEHNNIHIPIKHFANSTVFLKYPEMHLDAVRIGTLLSGQFPVGDMPHPFELTDPFSFKTKIISLREMQKGQYLGYYRTYRLKANAKVAVIPVGFSDGLVLEVANPPTNFLDLIKILLRTILRYFNYSRFTMNVKIKNENYPIRGKVFMQMTLIELPIHSDVEVGDIVEVPMRKTLIDQDIVRLYVQGDLSGKVSRGNKTVYITKEG
ncbi:MAG TPA: alanine racemase [Syntrophomonadaceae bacterium]|nr:alanine racemase [Syntrophomonadaceae bacterium]